MDGVELVEGEYCRASALPVSFSEQLFVGQGVKCTVPGRDVQARG